ncbi:MAG: iron-containing alcohol dehydrogenase [Oscillospiraceae bacterium]|nr:iron-containing alcohol dehydrogenase [Oscillospiraceae bacterium]
MNPLKKVYCRAFQICFRAALPFLPYREPKILNSMTEAAAELRQQKRSRVLIVTDASLSALGLLDGLMGALTDVGVAYSLYDKTVSNPTVQNVEEARAMYLADGCQAIIAFGGGSSIDCAKAAGARVVKPRQPVTKMGGLLKVMHRLPDLIAVPTTAGTGSETTLAAVITDPEKHHKYPINDFSLIPHYAILDYHVTLGLPPHVTATTGMDALTHAVEAYIGRSTTRHTRAMAVEAVTLIRTYLKRAYDNGQDVEARQNMQRAAYCAGIAFTQSYVGYVHGVAHSLGGRYGTAHGLANAVLLPIVLEHYGESCYKRLGRLACICGIAAENASDEEASRAFINWIKEMNRSMNIPEHLTGIRRSDIPAMARFADAESNPLYPVPKLMNAKELETLYTLAAGELLLN